jgi:hypothetical protein
MPTSPTGRKLVLNKETVRLLVDSPAAADAVTRIPCNTYTTCNTYAC